MEPIASRALHCQLAGKTEEVVVRFGLPRQEQEHFLSEYEIEIAGAVERYAICGFDSVQSLQLAMFIAGSVLESVPGASKWELNGESQTGFPRSPDDPFSGVLER